MSALTLEKTLRRFPALKQFVANPVVMRDLRAQMRGARSYWYISGYLLLLGILAIAGYAKSTEQNLNPFGPGTSMRSIVDAQASLEGFYYFIFFTLAGLITLIAPALTAASIVGERQRLSFDLLVTTPLTAGHILIGKLISSIAFLGMLLALSLPAAALCIILGGASLFDIFRVYFLLIVDGVVLSAIGLYFSCAVRVPLLATLWTYAAVAGFFLVTGIGAAFADMPGLTPIRQIPLLSLLWFNPLFATLPILNGEGTTWLTLFRLLVFTGVAGLFISLLLAASTYRLGLFGAKSAVTMRRLALWLTGIVAWFVSNAVAGSVSHVDDVNRWLPTYGLLFIGVFGIILPFLPGLFVPASADAAPPGATAAAAEDPAQHRLFVWKRIFRPEHAGALPWYLAFVGTVVVAILAGTFGSSAPWESVIPMAMAGGFYLIGLGGVCWILARLARRAVTDLSPARAIAFALYISVFGLPTLLFSLTNMQWGDHPLSVLWLLSPVLYRNHSGALMGGMIGAGGAALIMTTLLFLWDRYLGRGDSNAYPALESA